MSMETEVIPSRTHRNIYVSMLPSTSTSASQPKMKINEKITQNEAVGAVRKWTSPKSEKYIRKLDRLIKIYNHISEKNEKLRNHILRIKGEEIRKLVHLKKNLCYRLSSFSDKYMDENLRISETSNRDARIEKLIDEVVTKTAPTTASK